MRSDDSATLPGAVAVITGGHRGIGYAIARRLGELGASLVITGRDEAKLEPAAQKLSAVGYPCAAMVCDVRDVSSVERLAQRLRKPPGRVDILVNNAGVSGPATALHELRPEDWDAILETNLRGVYYMMRALVPLMMEAGSGHIINISSLAGKNPLPNGAAYAASKWGLNGLTYSTAEELRAHNIRVSLVCPGSVNTEFSPAGRKDPGKKLRPEDVAHVVAMLVTQQPQSFVSDVSIRPTQKP